MLGKKVRDSILVVLAILIFIFIVLGVIFLINLQRSVGDIKELRAEIDEVKAEIKELKAEMKEIEAPPLPPVRAVGKIEPPRLVKKVDPIYPEDARQKKVEGVVILEATTDIYGRVKRVKVLRSIPLLDQAAIDAVRQWVYEPAIIEGRPRGVVFTVTVRFKLK